MEMSPVSVSQSLGAYGMSVDNCQANGSTFSKAQ